MFCRRNPKRFQAFHFSFEDFQILKCLDLAQHSDNLKVLTCYLKTGFGGFHLSEAPRFYLAFQTSPEQGVHFPPLSQ